MNSIAANSFHKITLTKLLKLPQPKGMEFDTTTMTLQILRMMKGIKEFVHYLSMISKNGMNYSRHFLQKNTCRNLILSGVSFQKNYFVNQNSSSSVSKDIYVVHFFKELTQ